MVSEISDRNIYLEKQPLDKAKEIFLRKLKEDDFFTPQEKLCKVGKSLGRVTSRAVRAIRNSPHFRSSAMDGIAVRSIDTRGASKENPKRIKKGDFQYVDTGDRVSEKYDSVIMIEEVNQITTDEIEIYQSTFPGQHVRPIGEDFKEGQIVLPKDYKVTPEAIAALLSTGNFEIPVKARPICVFLPTGSELIYPDEDLGRQNVPETNSQIFRGYVESWGGKPKVLPIIGDKRASIRKAIENALPESHLLVISAGTSKGKKDYTVDLIKELGEVLIHGVAYRPGHPVVLGVVERKPLIGMPGYPVAAWLCLREFLKPILEAYFGLSLGDERMVRGELARKVNSTLGLREFVRVKVKKGNGEPQVIPLPRGSSKLSSLIFAQGLLEVPENLEGFHKGESVEVKLL